MKPNITQPFAVVRSDYILEPPIMYGNRHCGKFMGQELGQGEVVRRNEHLMPTAMKFREKGIECVAMSATKWQRGFPTYFDTGNKRRHRRSEIALICTRSVRKLDNAFKELN